MITTEKKHWVNGHQVRGGWFHTWTASLAGHAVMICWGTMPKHRAQGMKRNKLKIVFYKLV